MVKSTKSSKTSDFDVDKLIAEMEEQSRKEKEAEQKREAILKEYSIPWNKKDEEPPFPDMRLNVWLCRWEPEDIEKFILEHGEEVKRIAAEHEAEQVTARQPHLANATTRRQSCSTSVFHSSKSDSDQVAIMTEMRNPSQQNGTTSEDAPMVKAASSDKSMQTKSSLSQKETDLTVPDNAPVETVKEISVSPEFITATDTTIMTTPDKAETQPNATDTPTLTGKVTRISAKMRRASRQEFHDAYLVKTDTKGGKPITISADLIKRLYRICVRSGDYRACPTYLVNNLLMKILDIIEPDTEGWADLD